MDFRKFEVADHQSTVLARGLVGTATAACTRPQRKRALPAWTVTTVRRRREAARLIAPRATHSATPALIVTRDCLSRGISLPCSRPGLPAIAAL
jgi:hypothetical protein